MHITPGTRERQQEKTHCAARTHEEVVCMRTMQEKTHCAARTHEEDICMRTMQGAQPCPSVPSQSYFSVFLMCFPTQKFNSYGSGATEKQKM